MTDLIKIGSPIEVDDYYTIQKVENPEAIEMADEFPWVVFFNGEPEDSFQDRQGAYTYIDEMTTEEDGEEEDGPEDEMPEGMEVVDPFDEQDNLIQRVIDLEAYLEVLEQEKADVDGALDAAKDAVKVTAEEHKRLMDRVDDICDSLDQDGFSGSTLDEQVNRVREALTREARERVEAQSKASGQVSGGSKRLEVLGKRWGQLTHLDGPKVETIITAAVTELNKQLEGLGLVVSNGGIKYTGMWGESKVKFQVASKDAAGAIEDAAKTEWTRVCAKYGFLPEHFGKEIIVRGRVCTICGVKPANTKYPILYKTKQGKVYKDSASRVRTYLGI